MLRVCGLTLAIATAGLPHFAWAQQKTTTNTGHVHAAVDPTTTGQSTDEHLGMAMPHITLLVAQLDGEQVAPSTASKATGTGAFQLDPALRTIEYRLTYQGLESGRARSIALYNFGRGKNGKAMYLLCSEGRQPCPDAASATISGRIKRDGSPPDPKAVGEFEGPMLSNQLVSEFDSERVYVEIVGDDGKAEIRGQLMINDSITMVENYVAALAPVSGSKASGTAIVTKVYLPRGKVVMTYAATVAGTADQPTLAALSPKRSLKNKISLLGIKTRYSRDKLAGGSLLGNYKVNKTSAEAAPNLGTPSDTDETGIAVATSKFPDGEVFGVLKLVK
jgi:hypothetical protein